MNIADLRSVFHSIAAHWKAWGITGLLIGGTKAILVGLRHLYAWVLVKYSETKQQIIAETRKITASTSIGVPEESIVQRMQVPAWLVRRALRWDKRRKILGH
jgi:hypothetical protein